MKIGPVAYNLR